MPKRIAPLVEYIAESTTACLVTMVQGNLLALSVSHLLIASQTGIIAGAITAISVFTARADRRWIVAAVLGVITGVVDFFVHPGMFGTVAVEALVTGLGAAALSYLIGTAVRLVRARQ